MNRLKRMKIWVKVFQDYCCSFFPVKAKLLPAQETIDYVCHNGKSVIRFGDGEFNIILGGNVHYQEYDLKLQEELIRIIKEYNEDSPYLLCVPYRYFSKSNLVLNRRVLISCWSTPKQMFKKYFKRGIPYGDAFVFSKNNSRSNYQKMWENYKAIILVHNNDKYLEETFNLEKQKGYFVKVPLKNSYEIIDDIECEIERLFQENDLPKNNTAVLISAGPTAKALVYRLSIKGYKLIDCGHVWDDPLEV